ncbi:putative oxidoreductase [Xylariaceae sp. FL1272]|nr:putative oxidoreductase [Xylariaceae sp. FL1272]
MDQWEFSSNLTSSVSLGNLCCAALLTIFDATKVSFPGSAPYNSSISSYWSLQAATPQPACVFMPSSAHDVAKALHALTAVDPLTHDSNALHQTCPFAVRSGGHTSWAGAASIMDGVTVDMSSMNTVELSQDKSIVSVGVGARWQHVYDKLVPFNLTAVGGRNGLVGVGGLTTGGGVSHFSPRAGWSCDTVTNYEIVLADGSIVSSREDLELLSTLRGGSNNFGIVTKVDLKTLKQGPLWAGQIYNPIDTIDTVLKTLATLNSADGHDEYASLITAFGFSQGMVAIANDIAYTKDLANPPIFQPLEELPSLFNSMRITNVSNLAAEMATFQPVGLRELYASITVVSSLEMLNATYLCFNQTIENVQDIPGIVWTVVLEPLPQEIYSRAPKGTNALGLSDRTQPLIIVLVSATWQNEEDDNRINQQTQSLLRHIQEEAHRLNAYDPFIYLNYAAPWQDPIASYGKASVQKLQRVKARVDPHEVFTRNVPGGFKIPN